ncbi:Biotin carboxylase [Oscillospiraceae bacterium]|nr:Biotin carboxylase [Oscillospiraceae bacterium]
MKKLLVLGGSIAQIPFIKTAKNLSCIVAIVDYNKEAPAIEYADQYFECSLLDLSNLRAIANDFKPDGITCGASDVGVENCAILCSEFGLPGLSIDVARRVRDKGIMIEAFSRYGVPHPKYQVVSSIEEPIDIPFPVITKPVDKSGSRGINVAENPSELQAALADSFSVDGTEEVIVEEYMDGPEVSVEILVQNGIPHVLQVTDKMTTGAPHFIEIGHSQPSQLPSDAVDRIRRVAYDAVKAVGMTDGCCHAEIKLTDDGPKMIEIAGRQGGDFITTVLLPISTGINMSEYEIMRSLGTPIPFTEKNGVFRSVAVRFIEAKPGMLKSISLDYQAEAMIGIEELQFVCKAGVKYGDAQNNNDRFGYVIATGKTPQIAIDRCNKVIGQIDIEMK